MIPEYQFFHGAFLHEIVVSAGCDIKIALKDFHGRPNSFAINDFLGVLIKHSSARLTPWSFAFTKEHLAELLSLRAVTKLCFVILVCHDDGFVCIRDSDLIEILSPKNTDVLTVRVDRRPRKMYRVSSSGNALDRKLPKGVHEVVTEIQRHASEPAAQAGSVEVPETFEHRETGVGGPVIDDNISA